MNTRYFVNIIELYSYECIFKFSIFALPKILCPLKFSFWGKKSFSILQIGSQDKEYSFAKVLLVKVLK